MSDRSGLGEWRYICDTEATLKAYSRASAGGAETCGCAGCRNFVLARDEVFPPDFLSLLSDLGIDPRKDGEVYHNGRLAPGKHHYGGWFHFVGTLEKPGNFAPVRFGDEFIAFMCESSAPALAELRGLPLVQLEFEASGAPWRLNEPEAE